MNWRKLIALNIMIKAIIFDIGGVVTKTNFQAIYESFAERIGLDPDFVKKYHVDNRHELSVGQITLEEIWEAMRSSGAQSEEDFTEIWIEEGLKNRQVNHGLFSIIKKLREKYIVGTLTNLMPSRLVLDERMDIYSHFDFAILSCKENLRKPDAAFYQLALDAAKVEPKEAVFIDDKDDYVQGAEVVGIHAIKYIFPNNEELLADLEKLGVTI